jgi:hypothetical protein
MAVSILALAAPSAAGAAQPVATPAAGPLPGPEVWLKGAFGRVLGADAATPAAVLPSGAPLDTYVRRAPLTLEADVPFEELRDVAVVSQLLPQGSEVPLSDGASLFEGPDAVGTLIITATISTAGHGISEHAWLIAVPDRAWADDVLFGITPPEIRLVSDTDDIVGMAGNGCYAYLCSDTGGVPLPATLPSLSAGIGETLSVRTADGSALTGWTGRLRRLHDGTNAIEAAGVLGHGVGPTVSLSGLEAPAAGIWLLELRVDFDRERGWQWHAYHLIAE